MDRELVARKSEGSNPATHKEHSFSEVELGGRIVQLRRRKGWTRGELARRLGVPRDRLAKWEQGANLPPFGVLAPLALALEALS